MARPSAHVLVLGAGSIGSRHAANLTALGAAVDIADPDRSRAELVANVTVVAHDLDRLGGYDGVIVASPSVHHLEQTATAVRAGCRIMVEKPLAVDTAGLDDLIAVAGTQVMVGYNLRFHAPVARLVRLASTGRAGPIRTIRIWFGSWLPDWRPAVDYRSTYSAQATLGGGVLLDASHELDLLIWLLGPDLDVFGACVERLGSLEIDCEDTVRALVRGPGGTIAEIGLDYLSRVYRRGVEIVGDDATLRYDWSTQILSIDDPSRPESEVIDTPLALSYQAEAACFLVWLHGGPAPPVDAAMGAASVRLAGQIRDCAETSSVSGAVL